MEFKGENNLLESLDMVLYSAIFIVPGYVMYSGYSSIITNVNENLGSIIIRFFTFGLINYFLWGSVLTKQFVESSLTLSFESALFDRTTVSLIFLVIVPYILGLIAGIFAKKGWIRKVLNKININTVHKSSTAWDYVMDRAAYVIVTLKSGEIIYGFYGSSSLASSYSLERDIYIEELYELINDEWEIIDPVQGIWISREEIQSIRFQFQAIKQKKKQKNNHKCFNLFKKK